VSRGEVMTGNCLAGHMGRSRRVVQRVFETRPGMQRCDVKVSSGLRAMWMLECSVVA